MESQNLSKTLKDPTATVVRRANDLLSQLEKDKSIRKFDQVLRAGQVAPRTRLIYFQQIQPLILKALKLLYENGFIEIETTKQIARGGKGSKYYRLSLKGLTLLLSAMGKERKERQEETLINTLRIKNLAKNYQHFMPRIFEIWPSLCDAGVDEMGEGILLSIASRLQPIYPTASETVTFRPPWWGENPRSMFGEDFIDQVRWCIDKKWLKALRNIPKLGDWIIEVLDEEDKEITVKVQRTLMFLEDRKKASLEIKTQIKTQESSLDEGVRKISLALARERNRHIQFVF